MNKSNDNTTHDSSGEHLLEVRNLSTYFTAEEGIVKAVDNVTFHLGYGETLGIVGESGSGKSVTALSILRIIQDPPGKIVGGEIIFEGRNLLNLSGAKMRDIRGNQIAMIFQDPMTSLNPVLTIGDQMMETFRIHGRISAKEAHDKSVAMLKKVGMPLAEERMRQYPFELSGGMRQRVMIAMGLSLKPKLLIADEPTTALDVTIQAQILELIREMKQEFGSAVIMITHDLGVVASTCSRVIVMYGGQIMEEGSVQEIFHDPLHPYTKGLLACLPKPDEKRERLDPIPGSPPGLAELNPGCPFEERCNVKMEHCFENRPALKFYKDQRRVACWLFDEFKP
ncbi:ABC transporter ATP-binding protein [bacterium]|nr:ABC transporter ATP-binding protein [bacterium]